MTSDGCKRVLADQLDRLVLLDSQIERPPQRSC
jgi:hypothetical protein